jgi:hypothetical protein
MSAQIQELKRVFRLGQLELADPAPDESPEKAVLYHAAAFGVVRQATLSEGTIEGDKLVFDIVKPPAKTKG